jgi:hypothetical protein
MMSCAPRPSSKRFTSDGSVRSRLAIMDMPNRSSARRISAVISAVRSFAIESVMRGDTQPSLLKHSLVTICYGRALPPRMRLQEIE